MGRFTAPSNRSRKRPRGSPTHVGHLRLEPRPRQGRVILARGRACDRVYNACLSEGLACLETLRADPRFEQAKAGRHVKGACHWKNRSKSAQQTQAKTPEAHRVMSARRNSDHGEVANGLIAISPHIRTEDHATKSWQKGLWRRP